MSMHAVPSRLKGFTLLELLMSMSLLVVIVLMMSRMFADTTRMWDLGTRRIAEAQGARVVVDFLGREISTAVADELVSFKIHSEPSSSSLSVAAYGEDTDSICFVSTPRTPPWGSGPVRRSANQYVYYVDYMEDDETGDILDETHPDGPRYALMRRRLTRAMHSFADIPASLVLTNTPPLHRSKRVMNTAYKRKDWWLPPLMTVAPAETVARNIVAFEVWAQPQHYPSEYGFNFDSTYTPPGGDQPLGAPLWIDLYLEVMGEQDLAELGFRYQIYGATAPEFLEFRERNVRRYSTRIYFRNREKMLL